MLIYFDLDSTLCGIEWCDWLAQKQGVGNHVAQLTKETMEGTRSFDEVFISKTQLISPSRSDLSALGKEYIATITPWMADLISKLQQAGHTIGVISQWYRDAATELAEHLHIDQKETYALVFDHDAEGAYSWFPEQALKYENGKAVILRELKKRFPEEKIVFIGDSVGDMIAGQQADVFIACGIHACRDLVVKEAKQFANTVEELEDMLAMIN
jgi:HAD superfamily phosphoserine phosphatase-like hydrolase